MLNIIGAIFGGLIAGALARFFYPGDVPMGWIGTMLLGIGGALVVAIVVNLRTGEGLASGFNRAGCVGSVLGGMALIFLARVLGWG